GGGCGRNSAAGRVGGGQPTVGRDLRNTGCLGGERTSGSRVDVGAGSPGPLPERLLAQLRARHLACDAQAAGTGGATRSLTVAVALRPSSAIAHYNLGTVLYGRKDLTGAERCYLRAIELNLAMAPAHGELGLLMYERRDLTGAERCLLRALEIDPVNAVTHS